MNEPMDRQEAIDFARYMAYLHRDTHSYLPQTPEAMYDWEPHEWVIESILAASHLLNGPSTIMTRLDDQN